MSSARKTKSPPKTSNELASAEVQACYSAEEEKAPDAARPSPEPPSKCPGSEEDDGFTTVTNKRRKRRGVNSSDRRVMPVRNVKYGPGFFTDHKHRLVSLGDVIVAPHVEPYFDADTKEDAGEVIPSKTIGSVIVKMRYMIIVAKYTGHLTALPIYTHGKKGPPSAAERHRKQSVYVKNISDNRPFWSTVDSRFVVVNEESPYKAHFGAVTYPEKPLTVRYGSPIKKMGSITKSSLSQLVGLVKQSFLMGQEDFATQMAPLERK